MNGLEHLIDINKYAGMLAKQRHYLYSELSRLRDMNLISEDDIVRIDSTMVVMLKQDFPHLIPTGQNLI